MLFNNVCSLRQQTTPDYQHIILPDEERRGVDWANGMMADRDWSDIKGDYVMVLDDDDILSGPDVIITLESAAVDCWLENGEHPDLFVVQMDHGPRGILPRDQFYREDGLYPGRAQIGCSAVIPCRDLFIIAVKAYKSKYDGDYDYIEACLDNAIAPNWLKFIASKVTQIGALTEV